MGVAKLDKIAKEIAFAGRCKHDVSKDVQEFWDNTAEASRNVFLRQADAAIKALPDMVQPLVWVVEGVELHATGLGLSYIIEPTPLDASANWIGCGQDNGVLITGTCETLDAAKAATQSHYTAQIMKAMGVSDE